MADTTARRHWLLAVPRVSGWPRRVGSPGGGLCLPDRSSPRHHRPSGRSTTRRPRSVSDRTTCRCIRPGRPQPGLLRRFAPGHGLDVVFANAGGGEFAVLPDISWGHYSHHVQHQCRWDPVHCSGSIAIAEPSGVDHPQQLKHRHQRQPLIQRLRGLQGSHPLATRSWAAELAERRIRVNCVAPGPTGTPGLAGLATTQRPPTSCCRRWHRVSR